MFTTLYVHRVPKLIYVMSLARVSSLLWLWCWPDAAIKKWKEKTHRSGSRKMNGKEHTFISLLNWSCPISPDSEQPVCAWCQIRQTFSESSLLETEEAWRWRQHHTQSFSSQRKTCWNKNNSFPPQQGSVCILGQLPACGVVGGGLTFGARSQFQHRSTDFGPVKGGSDSGERGWVRRHVLNWHLKVQVSWMVAVSTIMLKTSYLWPVNLDLSKAVSIKSFLSRATTLNDYVQGFLMPPPPHTFTHTHS